LISDFQALGWRIFRTEKIFFLFFQTGMKATLLLVFLYALVDPGLARTPLTDCYSDQGTMCADRFPDGGGKFRECTVETKAECRLKFSTQPDAAKKIDSAKKQVSGNAPPAAQAGEVARVSADVKTKELVDTKQDLAASEDIIATKIARVHKSLGEKKKQFSSQSRDPKSKVMREKNQNDIRILSKVEDRLDSNGEVSVGLVSQVDDKEARKDLLLVSTFQEERIELQKKGTEIAKQVSELLALAARNMQNFKQLESLSSDVSNSTSSKKPSQIVSKTDDLSVAAAAESAGISEESVSVSLEQNEDFTDGDILMSPEARSKLKTGIAAAEKRKKALSLKNKLRSKIDGKTADADVTEKLFSGDLIPDSGETAMGGSAEFGGGGRDENSSSSGSRSYNESPVFQAMQAMQSNGFSMDSSQTEAEVSRMLAEAKEELGNSDRVGGILEFDSPSLFARVKMAHSSCLKRSCVRVNSL